MSRKHLLPSLTNAVQRAEAVVGQLYGEGSCWGFLFPMQFSDGVRCVEISASSRGEGKYLRHLFVAVHTLRLLGLCTDHAFEAVDRVTRRNRMTGWSSRDVAGEALVLELCS